MLTAARVCARLRVRVCYVQDYGVAQGTSTEVLKDYVRTEPVEVVTVSATDKLKVCAPAGESGSPHPRTHIAARSKRQLPPCPL